MMVVFSDDAWICRWYDNRDGEKVSNRVRDSDKLTICNCDVMTQHSRVANQIIGTVI
jgi:hypothetical protein